MSDRTLYPSRYDNEELKARAWTLRDEGLPYSTIAVQLDVSIKTVSTWLRHHQGYTPKAPWEMEELSPVPLIDLEKGCSRCGGLMFMSAARDEVGCLVCGHYIYNIASPVDSCPSQKLNGFNGRIMSVPRHRPKEARSVNTDGSVLVEAVSVRYKHPVTYRVYCPYDREEMQYAAGGELDRLIDPEGGWHIALLRCPQGHRVTIHPNSTHASWTPTPFGAGLKSEKNRTQLWK